MAGGLSHFNMERAKNFKAEIKTTSLHFNPSWLGYFPALLANLIMPFAKLQTHGLAVFNYYLVAIDHSSSLWEVNYPLMIIWFVNFSYPLSVQLLLILSGKFSTISNLVGIS